MITCYSCRWSFSSGSVTAVHQTQVTHHLRCRPGGEDPEQVAEIVCLKYQRESGADEPSEVNATEERK